MRRIRKKIPYLLPIIILLPRKKYHWPFGSRCTENIRLGGMHRSPFLLFSGIFNDNGFITSNTNNFEEVGDR